MYQELFRTAGKTQIPLERPISECLNGLFTNLMHKFFNTFIIYLYMFRGLICSSSGGHVVYCNIWYLVSSLSLGVCSVHRLTCAPNSHLKRVTIPDTICCTNTICPPEDEHNSPRNMQKSIINILKHLCIKLVKRLLLYQDARSTKY